jgi:hypothetical protein
MRVLIGAIFLVLQQGLSAQLDLKFEVIKSMPLGTVGFANAQSENNLYVIGGVSFNKFYTSNVQLYDNKLGKWQNFSLDAIPKQSYSSAIYVDEYKGIVLAGGVKQNGNSAILIDEIRMIYVKDFKVDRLGTIPTPAKNLGIALDKSIIYLYGGIIKKRVSTVGPINYTFSKKFYAYDLTNGLLDELPDLPIAMETKGGIIDNHLYILGGFDSKPLTSIWKYAINNKIWEKAMELDIPSSSNAIAQYGKFFVLVAGNYNSQLVLYDTENNVATYFTTNVQARNIAASIIGKELHLYGGINPGGGISVSAIHYKIPLSEVINNSN